jgi:hypothetical protein
MMMRHIVAVALAAAVAAVPILAQQAPPSVTMSGDAHKEAKKPYTDYTTRARNVQTGEIAGSATNAADNKASFTITGLAPANYLIELLDKNGKVVCTEGPYDMTTQFVRNDIDISCNKVPAAWWLLGIAAAAGITAGVVIAESSDPG